jgi:hypothetical protein
MDNFFIDYVSEYNKNKKNEVKNKLKSNIDAINIYKNTINPINTQDNPNNIELNLQKYYNENLILGNNHYESITQNIENNLNKSKKNIVDVPSYEINRFYNLHKNPQLNCIEHFTRGGENTVLNLIDNYKC